MNNEMTEFSAKMLAKRMETIADMYTMSIFYGKLKFIQHWECGCLNVVHCKLEGTYYASTAIFFAEDLIAIVAENGVMFEFVDMYDECDENKQQIILDLHEFIKTGFGPSKIVRYPKLQEE